MVTFWFDSLLVSSRVSTCVEKVLKKSSFCPDECAQHYTPFPVESPVKGGPFHQTPLTLIAFVTLVILSIELLSPNVPTPPWSKRVLVVSVTSLTLCLDPDRGPSSEYLCLFRSSWSLIQASERGGKVPFSFWQVAPMAV